MSPIPYCNFFDSNIRFSAQTTTRRPVEGFLDRDAMFAYSAKEARAGVAEKGRNEPRWDTTACSRNVELMAG